MKGDASHWAGFREAAAAGHSEFVRGRESVGEREKRENGPHDHCRTEAWPSDMSVV